MPGGRNVHLSGSHSCNQGPDSAWGAARLNPRNWVASYRLDGLYFLQARQDFFRKQADALLAFAVRHEAGAADQGQVTEAADLVVELHDLAVDAVGVADKQDAHRHRLFDPQ